MTNKLFVDFSEINEILEDALNNASSYLRSFRDDAGYIQKLETAFGNGFNREEANQLFDKFAQGDFSNIPSIEIVNRNDINGANGAFSITTGKIYLAAEFISQNAQNINTITAVLLEEIGHSIDAQINVADAAGDEGDIFARLVQGESLSQSELAVLKAEDDSATVTVDSQDIQIEQNVQSQSQFLTLRKPVSLSNETKTVIRYGSNQEDIIQLQSYRTDTAGLVQRVWGYGGADIFNVNFELPSDGKVGIDFNTGNLKKLAQKLVEPDWDVRGKRIAMDVAHAVAGATIDYAVAAASGAVSSVPFAGAGLAAGIEAAGIAANLAIDLANITAHADLDIEEYNNSLADIDDFFADQNNQNWGTVNILDARTVVEIRDFQPGIDIITLPKLPTNWTWAVGSGVFSDTGKNYVSVSFANGTNASAEILRIGFEDTISQQIDNKQNLINNLLVTSNSGWAIGDTFKEKKSTLNSVLNGTVVNDVLSILPTNTFSRVTLSGGLGDDFLEGRNNNSQIDVINAGPGNDYIIPGAGQDEIDGGDGFDRVDYSNLLTGVNITSSRFTSVEGILGTIYNDTLDLSSLTVPNPADLIAGLIAIKGNDGADRLIGSNYSDLLDGGTGNDTLIGGTGNDIYIINDIIPLTSFINSTDTIIENANEGTDTVESSFSFSLTTLSNIENLTLKGTSAIDGTGNTANNLIIGNAGNNTLDSGAGNDTLDGGAGSDALIGGTGNDIYIVDTNTDTITENANEGTDTVESSLTFSLATLSNIENLTLKGTSVINGTGNTANNVIKGNARKNILDGGAGNDALDGGAGSDTLIGGTGDDTLKGGDGSDIPETITFKEVQELNSNYGLNGNFTNLIVGDFDGDGFKDDFIRQEKGAWDDDSLNTAEIFIGQGNDTFSKQALTDSDGMKGDLTNLIVGDFNNDGRDDFLRQEKGAWANDQAHMAEIYLSHGNGSFTKLPELPFNYGLNGNFTNLIVGDFDGDGFKDDFIRQEKGHWVANNDKPPTEIFIRQNDGTFSTQALTDDYRLDGLMNGDNSNLLVGDFNNDGRDDFLLQDNTSILEALGPLFRNNHQVYFSNGNGSFTRESVSNLLIANSNLIVGDFDGDGFKDDFINHPDSESEIFIGHGNGTFSRQTLTDDDRMKGDLTNLMVGDFNNDRKDDFLRQEKGEWANDDANMAEIYSNISTTRDVLTGGSGKDTLTRGSGANIFDYRNLTDSLLNNFDVVTDFNANTNKDLFLVSTARAGFSNVGSVTNLDATGIAAKLTTTSFGSKFAAQFTFGTRTFVAINDATSGFNANTDAIIEVTGLTGTLGISNFTTSF